MSTPHNSAEVGDIARIVLMPGDPNRAEKLAKEWLDSPHLYTKVRGILGFTGTYKGFPVSVQASGMGIPSIAIYSWELYHVYGVDAVIRIGTCGGMVPKVRMGDLVLAEGSSTDSNFGAGFHASGQISAIADWDLLETAVQTAREQKVRFHVGNVASGDTFYEETDTLEGWAKMGCLAGEMESYGLYLNAARASKRALAILTVTDEMYADTHASIEDRENAYVHMGRVALETAVKMYRSGLIGGAKP
ncbi:purine-nucleoside phosphorylase [Chordicoccus furentiruminis]|jgi:purine-nucleoside phosphorylase|uniref:purine-nucleoside phosphorylase n=1 Tax=Chordicoccus furentiruminis TaxID=2709410 RepID=UPI0023A7DA88|nr:purine-nucleoside phosphorylase [Chordicoccus furentiruminis]